MMTTLEERPILSAESGTIVSRGRYASAPTATGAGAVGLGN
jgi:hypothetical protein